MELMSVCFHAGALEKIHLTGRQMEKHQKELEVRE